MLGVLTAAVLAVPCADAYCRKTVNDNLTGATPIFWPANTTIVWRANQDGDSEIAGDAEFDAMRAAFSSWSDELGKCSSLKLVEGARTTKREAGWSPQDLDPQNVLIFRKQKCSAVVPTGTTCTGNGDCANTWDCWEYGANALAVTTTSFNKTNGTIYDADIEFNLPDYLFTVVDAPACPMGACALNCVCTDIQNATTHEIGHLLGLDHSTRLGSTMHPRTDSGELVKRTIDPGTASFVCDVYPSTGLVRVPLADGKYPAGCGVAPGGITAAAAALLALALKRGRA